MWQRKQTIFLAIVVCCMALSLFLPIWESDAQGAERVLYPIHYSTVEGGAIKETVYFPYCLVAVLAVASATLAFIEIGKFGNRLLQLKLGALNSLFIMGTTGLGLYFVNDLNEMHNGSSVYGAAVILPLVAMLCNVLANRFIRRDEKMIRDSERLR